MANSLENTFAISALQELRIWTIDFSNFWKSTYILFIFFGSFQNALEGTHPNEIVDTASCIFLYPYSEAESFQLWIVVSMEINMEWIYNVFQTNRVK